MFFWQIVALKYIPKHGKSEKDLRNLRQEIDIQRKLDHPNIIVLLDAFETQNEFCIVTEFAQVCMCALIPLATRCACACARVHGSV